MGYVRINQGERQTVLLTHQVHTWSPWLCWWWWWRKYYWWWRWSQYYIWWWWRKYYWWWRNNKKTCWILNCMGGLWTLNRADLHTFVVKMSRVEFTRFFKTIIFILLVFLLVFYSYFCLKSARISLVFSKKWARMKNLSHCIGKTSKENRSLFLGIAQCKMLEKSKVGACCV